MYKKLVLSSVILFNVQLVHVQEAISCTSKPLSFVKETPKKSNKSEKNVTQKVIDTAKQVCDQVADAVITLTEFGKKLSDAVFEKLETGDKKELTNLLSRLRACQKELLEIQEKIDTLQI